MQTIIKDIEKNIKLANEKIEFRNSKLNTIVHTSDKIFYNDLKDFSKAFNELFQFNSNNENELNAYIINNDDLYSKVLNFINDESLILTEGIINFNKATITTSCAKCTQDYNYYIIKCYEYFVYVFDKKKKRCFMLIKNNKKALTMINILILTPYLMYGELFAVHGGLVNKDDKNVLINNSSLGGKTTFAILFASNNWDIITEETTYITNDGKILPFNIRNYFNIRVGTYLNFYDFFESKKIIIDEFLKMRNNTLLDLYEAGKKNQQSIDFNEIGKFKKLEKEYITSSLKVSIQKDENFTIDSCSPIENVNSFLELSLAPTVLLFKELLNYNEIDINIRKNQLEKIFNNTKSYKIISGFDYKDHFNEILDKI